MSPLAASYAATSPAWPTATTTSPSAAAEMGQSGPWDTQRKGGGEVCTAAETSVEVHLDCAVAGAAKHQLDDNTKIVATAVRAWCIDLRSANDRALLCLVSEVAD